MRRLPWEDLREVCQSPLTTELRFTRARVVRVPRSAAMSRLVAVAQRLVEARAHSAEAVLARMERGLSPAELGADADRGLTVARGEEEWVAHE